MSRDIKLTCNNPRIDAEIWLNGSKSITNRVLLINALCEEKIDIINGSDSDDSVVLKNILSQSEGPYDVGHAGTTFRFLTAYFAMQSGTQVLTGSDRMKQRPIKALVDALNTIGANIKYESNDGYPPLKIYPPSKDIKSEVTIKADISSQYISALLMIAPTMPDGLTIHLEGELVSRPYLLMTLSIMKYFGVGHHWKENSIVIPPQKYIAKPFFIEADWSSASYLYSWAALSDEAKIRVHGLTEHSLQGDSAIKQIGEYFGIKTMWIAENLVEITKPKNAICKPFLEYNFIECPDIAQTIFTICAAKGVKGLFSGLQTLYIKETDRINAFKIELQKVGVSLYKVPSKFMKNNNDEHFILEGDIVFNDIPKFETYHDHRMAMALAALSILHPIYILDADVVNKSYPNYWEDVERLGVEKFRL